MIGGWGWDCYELASRTSTMPFLVLFVRAIALIQRAGGSSCFQANRQQGASAQIARQSDCTTQHLFDRIPRTCPLCLQRTSGMCSVRRKTKEGSSVLHKAAGGGHKAQLTQAGAEINYRAGVGNTPSIVRIRGGFGEVVGVLIKAGADAALITAHGGESPAVWIPPFHTHSKKIPP